MFIFQYIKIQNTIKEPKIIQFSQLIIQQLWMVEKNENVRNIFKDQEMINQQKKLYSHELNTFSQKLQQKFKQKLGELQKLEAEIRQEGLINDKFELKKRLQEKQNEFSNYLKNINEMTQQINISFIFLQEIHNEISILQNKIDKIQTNVDDILADIRQLRGKTYKELLTMRKNKILHEQQITDMNSIYIELKKNRRYYQSERQPSTENQIQTFYYKRKKMKLIQHKLFKKKKQIGQAGSGKSRAAKKIEEYIWKLYQGRSEDWIPIFISLPSLKDPKKNLFNEALESDFYHFDKIQIKELKDAIQNDREKIVTKSL
ncbi:unnamed protein product [Paramecium sonneborni]|uniref:Uncharacterized protein n=1 Tax=Paramecium sonneborni TaxID=65129 RepID=A0A8S1JZ95_9CILI|nr:unnamed protein product [Paramecium sonneborni]